jgi:HNH endonuclease
MRRIAPRKKRLFDQGVSAAETLGLKDTYLCPLCATGFNPAALAIGKLTLEHVPPASRGGKPIILTCRPCNSVAGHEIDAEAAKRDEMTNFVQVLLQGKPGQAGRATATWGNQPLRIDVSVDASRTVDLKVIKDSNDPAKVHASTEFMKELMKAGKTDGYSFKVTAAVRFHPRKAQISDLKAAYLACVARFGYRYASHNALDQVRAQIARPEERILENWSVPKNLLESDQAIAVFIEDGIVAVALGAATVFLPWPSKPVDQYLQWMARLSSGQQVTFQKGQLFSWPNSFEAMLDHNWSRKKLRSEEAITDERA